MSAAHAKEETLRDLRASAIERLREASIETPEADVRVLLKFALGLDDAALVSASGAHISNSQRRDFEEFLARRISGEPAARIIGAKEFWSRSFRLSPETLIPRPESETLVEAALAIFADPNTPLHVLDLGTGSGILLAAILLERPRATGVAIDLSEDALRVARESCKTLGLAERAQFICGEWACALDQKFDLIVSNPPYIASGEIAALAREVREHDPRRALDGGADGLEAYRQIIAELPHLLSKEGAAVLEIGIGQEMDVARLARAQGLQVAGPARCDLANIPRALIVRRGV